MNAVYPRRGKGCSPGRIGPRVVRGACYVAWACVFVGLYVSSELNLAVGGEGRLGNKPALLSFRQPKIVS